MVQEVKCEGLSEFLTTVESNKNKAIFVLFTGSVDENGESWCPDCVKAHPVIEKCVKGAPDDSVFVTCGVGERTSWKDKQNEFRTHEKLHLTGVPTLLKWGSPKRLVEDDCANEDLVSMFFEEE